MSTVPHTEGRVTFHENGDANHWSMLDEAGHWRLSLLANGEQTTPRQVADFRRLGACWNACRRLPTEVLENMTQVGDTLADRFRVRDQIERELLQALQDAVARQAYEPGKGPDWWERARTVIANVTQGNG